MQLMLHPSLSPSLSLSLSLSIVRVTHVFSTVKVKVILWLTVSRPVCTGVRPASGNLSQLFSQFPGNNLQIVPVYL
jgi:hypothetical protein